MRPLRLASQSLRAGGPRPPVPFLTIAVVALCAALWAASPWAFPDRAHVPLVVVENHTDWPANVWVRQPTSGGWTGLGRVPAATTRSFHDAPDPGQRWEVRYGYGGTALAVVTVDRSDLQAAGWHLVVPDELARQAAAAGLAPVLPQIQEGAG